MESLEKSKCDEFFKHNIINNLAAPLGSDGVFLHSNANTACNYINYKLNESLRTHYSHLHEIDYSIFKEFAKVYYNKKHNNYYGNTSCENYIKKLDNNIYNRMLVLYKMYNHYNELKRPNNYLHYESNDNFCNNLNLLVRYSNEYIDQNTKYHEYISSIKKLKDIIDKDKESEQYKKKCKLNVLDGMLSKLTNSRVQISKEENSALDSNVAPKTQQPDDLQHQRREAENEQALNQQNSKEDAVRELESTDKSAMELAPQEQEERELTSQEQEATAQESEIHVNRAQAGIYTSMSRHVSNDQGVTGRLDGRYISLETEAPRGGTEGVLVKVQSFITDTLGQVEPAPILGVSGGMGVLFLLFKVFNVLKL
ncbi:hypothetical protein PVIIG_06061 [Plasmodium vivax India VII]|uniref:VIR protein n=1 Tax=Plasmodium vivax India VII TaxID=1077284 RepID=A0A0J9S5D0_PLAVI|nr:hypothetical protein PVIIG_06061 [Plasmodium vivax India VII]